jgi:hypothetical protein
MASFWPDLSCSCSSRGAGCSSTSGSASSSASGPRLDMVNAAMTTEQVVQDSRKQPGPTHQEVCEGRDEECQNDIWRL